MYQSHAFGPRPLRFQLSFGVVTLLMFSLFAVAPLLGILVYSYQENERSALANLERQVNRNMAETQQASVELIDSVARNMAIVAAVTADGGQLVERCRSEGVQPVLTAAVSQYGPFGLRTKASWSAALEVLTSHSRARMMMEGNRRLIAVNPVLLG